MTHITALLTNVKHIYIVAMHKMIDKTQK